MYIDLLPGLRGTPAGMMTTSAFLSAVSKFSGALKP